MMRIRLLAVPALAALMLPAISEAGVGLRGRIGTRSGQVISVTPIGTTNSAASTTKTQGAAAPAATPAPAPVKPLPPPVPGASGNCRRPLMRAKRLRRRRLRRPSPRTIFEIVWRRQWLRRRQTWRLPRESSAGIRQWPPGLWLLPTAVPGRAAVSLLAVRLRTSNCPHRSRPSIIRRRKPATRGIRTSPELGLALHRQWEWRARNDGTWNDAAIRSSAPGIRAPAVRPRPTAVINLDA